jgi:hypothetical protein
MKKKIEENSFTMINPNLNSDPYDETEILNLIQYNIEKDNLSLVIKLILWRKRILEISKNNGWIVGKILSKTTLNKLEIKDSDIIDANLTFLDKFHILNRIEKENFHIGIDYKGLFKEYENKLIESCNEI